MGTGRAASLMGQWKMGAPLLVLLLAVSSVVAPTGLTRHDELAALKRLADSRKPQEMHKLKDDPRMSRSKWRLEMKGAYVFVCKEAGANCVQAIENDNVGQYK